MESSVLLGYADQFSVAPGESLKVMVSTSAPSYRAHLVRLMHGDANPAGPGIQEKAVPNAADGTYSGRLQTSQGGSHVRVPLATALDLSSGFTFTAWIWPTLPARGGSIFACPSRGFALGLREGRVWLRVGESSWTVGEPLPARRWAFVAASSNGLFIASAEPYTSHAMLGVELDAGGVVLEEELLIGSGFNGKIDRPKLFDRALKQDELQTAEGALADWDFAADIPSTRVTDRSANGFHGQTFNAPTRGVTDHTWTGDEVRWTLAPDQYSAIHFHDDDLDDARWEPDFDVRIAADQRSGVFAVRLETDDAEEYVPFYVRPPRGTASAPVAFLAPTLTYLAYANERLYWNPGYIEKRPRVTPLTTEPPEIDRYMSEHRELGLSMYDAHSDGTGVSYSSRLRPILNMRPRYRAWRLHDAPRHFAGDLYLCGFLERLFDGQYDVITDEDLHREGLALLERYRVVLTGSHPEYHTTPMLDAMQAYLEQGGRLMYLGGNGFYWVTSIDPERPHLIELRRGVQGTRSWESLPGEMYHNTTGELGGLWRMRGRGPQRTVGVGFAAQGWGGACGYRRLPASFDPRAQFIFDGIGADEVIGDFGFVLGGAAGDEIDRFDLDLGSPAHGLVLATSAGQHTDYYQVTSEDVPIMVPGQGGTESPKVRADMVFFETPNGGGVFSVGSINWLGSLGWNAYDNNVARVTANVVRRFSDPAPL